MRMEPININQYDIMACKTNKRDPPLSVDANAVLTGPLASELLKPICWRNLEVIEGRRRVEHPELSQSDALDRCPESLHPLATEESLGVPVPEALDHQET